MKPVCINTLGKQSHTNPQTKQNVNSRRMITLLKCLTLVAGAQDHGRRSGSLTVRGGSARVDRLERRVAVATHNYRPHSEHSTSLRESSQGRNRVTTRHNCGSVASGWTVKTTLAVANHNWPPAVEQGVDCVQLYRLLA